MNHHHPMEIGKQPLLWLDFSDKDALELADDCISQAKDKSGRGHHFYSPFDVTEKPVWVDNGVQFKEIQHIKTEPYAFGQEIFHEYMAVVILPSDRYRIIKNDMYPDVGYALFNDIRISINPDEELSENVLRIIGVKIDSYPMNQASFYNNGMKTSSQNSFGDYRAVGDQLSLGYGSVYSGLEMPIIKELLLFEPLGEHQRQSITRYLANKWDIEI